MVRLKFLERKAHFYSDRGLDAYLFCAGVGLGCLLSGATGGLALWLYLVFSVL